MQDALPPAPSVLMQPSETRESSETRQNAVHADLGLGVVGLSYERMVGRYASVQPSIHIFGTWFGPYFDLPRFGGFGAQLRASVFPRGEGSKGLYLSPFFRVDRTSTEVGGETARTTGTSTGVFVGYSFQVLEKLIPDGLNLRIGAGVQYMRYVASNAFGEARFDRYFPALDALVGYRF